MRCWLCGAIPDDVEIIRVYGEPEPQLLVLGWDDRAADHSHALYPEAGKVVVAAGPSALRRVLQQRGGPER